MKELIEKDILDWVENYIEVNHEFYNNKFSPCPFARKARLGGNLLITAWESGSYRSFIEDQLQKTPTVKIMVFPPSFKYAWFTRYYIRNLNKKIVSQDCYIQCGNAVNTESKYPGLKGNYSIVIVNKLSDIIAGHMSLKSTNYYANWTKQHYHNVVEVRQQIKDRYGKIN
jgi:hypothetical protein